MIGPDAAAALGPVVAALHDLGIRYYVGGSLASSAHGVPRSSLDVDVLAELDAAGLSPFLERLAGYYVPERMARDAVAQARSFNLVHLETMVKIDVFVSRRRAFDEQCLARSVPREVAGGGIRAQFASAEDIVLIKLDWYRRGGETSERQWADVQGVLRAIRQAGGDRDYLVRWAGTLGVRDLLDRALGEADWGAVG